jgi:hypothetical protein
VIYIKNKVLVKLIVPEIDQSFDIYLPINKKIGNIINLLNKYVSEISDGELVESNANSLYNVDTLEVYSPDVLLINTSIRNGSKLVLIS